MTYIKKIKKKGMNKMTVARFSFEEKDNYGGGSGGSFFFLKNDKDVAKVRFMYNTLDDILGYVVHQVEVDGKKRYVSCLRNHRDPIEKCPFCASGMKIIAKLFVYLYNEDAQEVQIWERGKMFFSKLQSLTSRYNPLVSTSFEVERNGKPGETSTTYETYPIDVNDGTTLEDLPEVPEVVGTIILQKNAEEMMYFLDTGQFPDQGNQAPRDNQYQANQGETTRRPEVDNQQRARRRTPTRRDVPMDRF